MAPFKVVLEITVWALVVWGGPKCMVSGGRDCEIWSQCTVRSFVFTTVCVCVCVLCVHCYLSAVKQEVCMCSSCGSYLTTSTSQSSPGIDISPYGHLCGLEIPVILGF